MNRVLMLLPLIVLSACGGNSDGGKWSNDCWTYHSMNSRELGKCKERVEEGHLLEINPGEVRIDRGDEELTSHKEIGKERSSSIK